MFARTKTAWTLMLATALGVAGMVGCESQPTERPGAWGAYTGTETREGEPAPRPAPAPAKNYGDGMVHSTLYYPTGERSTSALMLHRVAPAEVVVGQPFDYIIEVTNISNMTLDDVVVTNPSPEGFTMTSSDPVATGANTWALGTLAPGEMKTIKISGSAAAAGTLKDCTTVAFVPKACLEVAVVAPALQLTKSAPAEVLLCDPITVKFVVTNTGSGTARNVSIKDELPAGLLTEDSKTSILINVGDLAAGASKEATVSLKATDVGSYDNKAVASSDSGLTAEAATNTKVVEPVLTIAKTGTERAFIGRTATYEITVSNSGSAAAKDVVVTDTIPAGSSFASATQGGTASGGTVSWNLGELAVGASKSVSLTVNVGGAGVIENVASAKAVCAKPVSASAKTAVEGIPAVLLEVVDNPDPVEVGQTTTYTITVTNQGSADATNVVIVNTLEAQQDYVSSTGATQGTLNGKTLNFAPLPVLAPKASASWQVVIKANDAGDVRFTTKMKCDQITRDVEETESTNLYK